MVRQFKKENIERHFTYFKLIDALKTEFCPICFMVNKSSWDYFDSFLYEGVNDPQLRERLRKAKGYCRTHAWQLSQCGDAFGTAIIYHDLVQQLIEDISLLDKKRSKKKEKFSLGFLKEQHNLAGDKAKNSGCPVCAHLADMEEAYLGLMVKYLNEPDFVNIYRNSIGLCYPHFKIALHLEPDQNALTILFEKENAIIATLQAELAEFIRKHDYRYTKEQFTDGERTAWLRTISHFVGMDWTAFKAHPRIKEKAEQLQLKIEQLLRVNERQQKELIRLKSIESKAASLHYRVAQQGKTIQTQEMNIAGLRSERDHLLQLLKELRETVTQYQKKSNALE